MIRAFAAAVLLFAAPAAFACKCASESRTLAQRIDEADRVLLVQVTEARLVDGEVALRDEGIDPASLPAVMRASGLFDGYEYRVRVLDDLKGSATPLPRIASSPQGYCTARLQVGDGVLLFLDADDDALEVTQCTSRVEPLDFERSSPITRLASIAAYVRDGTPVDDCDNLPDVPSDQEERCTARADAAEDALAHREWSEREAIRD